MNANDTPDCPAWVAPDFTQPMFCLFGVAFDQVKMNQVVERAGSSVSVPNRLVISTPNVNNIVAAQKDHAFRDAVARCNLVVADGMPLVWVGRMLGIKARRIAGSDFFDHLMCGGAGHLKVFFFGGPEGVAATASRRISHQSGAMTGVGGLYPGFGSVADMASDEVVATINAAKPDFLVVALGTAKGQSWIEHIQPKLTVPMISHLGAVVNFAAGSIRRSPWILQATGMEWTWRIWEEPALWRRYYNDGKALIGLFGRHTIPLFWRRLTSPLRGSGPAATVDVATDSSGVVLRLAGDWTDADAHRLGEHLNSLTAPRQSIHIDVSGMTAISQAIVAKFIRLRGHQQRNAAAFALTGASQAVARDLYLHGATYLLGEQPVPAPAQQKVHTA